MPPIRRWKTTSAIHINLEAIRKNYARLRQQIGEEPKVMAVIKADAYGHGSIRLAEALNGLADWFAVNDVEEGIALRDADIDQPILVFGVPDADNGELYSAYSLTASIGDLQHFGLLPAGTEYQLNFDTGMGRLGFRPEALPDVLKAMESHQELMCTGVYTHFATSDQAESEKVVRQLHAFTQIRKQLPDTLLTHVSNTGGAHLYQDLEYDMVRSGIGLYGYPPGDVAVEGLQPALEWLSHLAQVKAIKKGDTVSYGARWEAPEDGYVGVVPVGYSDGLSRSLSGDIAFKIGGKSYPQVGTITMNYCMVYLGQDACNTGDEVVLIDAADNTLMEWAARLNTIPYEILTSISPWIPRYYNGE